MYLRDFKASLLSALRVPPSYKVYGLGMVFGHPCLPKPHTPRYLISGMPVALNAAEE